MLFICLCPVALHIVPNGFIAHKVICQQKNNLSHFQNFGTYFGTVNMAILTYNLDQEWKRMIANAKKSEFVRPDREKLFRRMIGPHDG